MSDRQTRTRTAAQTLEILDQGGYTLGGQRVSIGGWLTQAVHSTRVFDPQTLATLAGELAAAPGRKTRFRVINATTLAAARPLAGDDGHDPLCLNFASASKPGGGFLSGAQAQEESLARASGLYACLRAATTYYTANRDCGSALYTDHMVWSPGVPVFRDDRDALLPNPYRVSMVTAPAVNLTALRRNEPHRLDEVAPVMRRRMTRLLALARARGHRRLVLGAWGCGVFGHDPADVAEWFHRLLTADPRFAGAFEEVIFAVLDRAREKAIFEAFRQRFKPEA